MKRQWYIGKYRGWQGLHEICWGIVSTGYWYAGGPEQKPYTHIFWGLVWAGKWTFGVGYTYPENLLDYPDVDVINEE